MSRPPLYLFGDESMDFANFWDWTKTRERERLVYMYILYTPCFISCGFLLFVLLWCIVIHDENENEVPGTSSTISTYFYILLVHTVPRSYRGSFFKFKWWTMLDLPRAQLSGREKEKNCQPYVLIVLCSFPAYGPEIDEHGGIITIQQNITY